MIPGIDGFETCRRLKADDRTTSIPVIFMTALTSTEDKVTGFEAGSVDYITKPFQVEEVLARVRTHLALQKLQNELKWKNQQLEDLLNEKDELLGIVAHDLKNPLTSIQLTINPILQRIDTFSRTELQNRLSRIRDSVSNMNSIIKHLLDANRIESRKLVVKTNPTDVNMIAEQVIKSYQPRALSKQIELTTQFETALPFALVDTTFFDTRNRVNINRYVRRSIRVSGIRDAYLVLPGFGQFGGRGESDFGHFRKMSCKAASNSGN